MITVAPPPVRRRIGPQPGRQTAFLATPADIAIYGGAAGSGKSWALLLEGLRHVHNPGFRAVYFRRTSPELRAPGGLWDTSRGLYSQVGGKARDALLEWRFPSGAIIKMNHMEHAGDRFSHQGAQYAFIGWDEVNHFPASVFWYLMSRNRSACGVRPYVRATTNPDPDSWVASFISWWLDQETGLPIPERVGRLRWFVRIGDATCWGDTREDAVREAMDGGLDAEAASASVLSATFIAATLADNPALLEADPGYRAKLAALSYVDRMRLLEGNWKVRESAGLMFRREWFRIEDGRAPPEATRLRYWDLAASAHHKADETAGVLLAAHNGQYWVEDVVAIRERPLGVEQAIRQTAEADGRDVAVWIEQEAIGSVGEHLLDHYQRQVLQGWSVYGASARGAGSKIQRAKPASAAAEAGLVTVCRGAWNGRFLDQAQGFPEARYDDQVDAFVGAFSRVNEGGFAFVSV